jgi:hypothetical protein
MGNTEMNLPKKRKRGGQRKPAAERKRNNLTIRLIDELRAKLEAASRVSGRSMSEEAAWRLTMSFLFNNEIQVVSQVQRSLGDVMKEILTKEGWRVGLDEVRRSISHWWDHAPQVGASVFIPPELQQFLRRTSGEGGEQPEAQQQEEHNEGSDAAQVTATPSRATVTQARAGESK